MTTKETAVPQPNADTPNRWTLSEEGKHTAARVRKLQQESREEREHLTPPCPEDGKPATYVRMVGSPQMAVPVYRCPDGHEFSWRADLNTGKLRSSR